MNKIRFKITSVMILCSLTMVVLTSSIGLFTNYYFFKKEINEKLILLSENYSNNFNKDFKGIESSINTLHHFITATFDLGKFNKDAESYIDEYERMMNNVIKEAAEKVNGEEGLHTINGIEAVYLTLNPELTGNVREIWYADKEGNGILEKLDSDADPKDPYIEYFYLENQEMSWYYNPIKNKKGVWSDPYEETDLNIEIVSYTEPIFKENTLIGVVGMDININAMKKTIENLKVYDTGYAFLMCDDYDFLVHPYFKMGDNLNAIENGSLKYVKESMDNNNLGVVNYEYEGEDKILGYAHLCNGWILGFVAPMNEVFLSLKIQIFLNIIITLLCICIIILITLYIGKSISNPICKMTQLIKNTADFKFVNEQSLEELLQNKDEIGILAEEMVNMRKILKETGVHKAAILQKQSLQKEFPITNKVDMASLYVPAKTVSGDFYRMQKINDHVVVGILFDVSGKGVTAALNTSAFDVLFHEAVLNSQNPIEILQDLNNKVINFLGEMYIAACCFSLDFEKNIAKIAGAGLNQCIFQNNRNKVEEIIVKGPFLGMFENSIFDEEHMYFQKGDKFYFFTDGLEFIFDDEGMRENYLKKNTITELKEYISKLVKDKEGIKDDCTLLVLEIK